MHGVVTRVLQWLRGPAASGGQTVLANNRNGGRLRLIASRHYYYYKHKANVQDLKHRQPPRCVGILCQIFGLGSRQSAWCKPWVERWAAAVACRSHGRRAGRRTDTGHRARPPPSQQHRLLPASLCHYNTKHNHTTPRRVVAWSIRYDTIYDRWFALENWQASCQFNLAHELKEN